jgi:hypothetical protein
MYNPWFALSLNAVQLGIEAQSVIALRMLRFASGGARMEAEATRMVTEKVAAAVEPQTAAAVAAVSGRSQHVVANKSAEGIQKTRTSQQAAAFAPLVECCPTRENSHG